MGSDDREVSYVLEMCDQYDGECNPEWFEDEQPAHLVVMDGFWIDQLEITNRQYRLCVEAEGCEPPAESGSYSRSSYYEDSAYEECPVIWVNWHQAAAYCEWAGARLPTEAEWEYAARGPESRIFPWGNEFDGTRLNFCDANCTYDWAYRAVDDGYADTAPVGSYPAGESWCGVQDLAGNVWEWVADRYGAYPAGRQQNPTGPTSGESRVVRGGSWYFDPVFVRSASRGWLRPEGVDFILGFRCARDADLE